MALTQVGVLEVGGNNSGREVKAYLASTGLKEGPPWCAAFVHWNYRQCDRVIEPSRSFALAASWHPKSRRIWQRGSWTPDTAKTFTRITRNGDMFSLWYTTLSPPRIGHTGIVYDEDPQYVFTVEGNTSSGGSRDGDGVYLRKRLKKSLYCLSRW